MVISFLLKISVYNVAQKREIVEVFFIFFTKNRVKFIFPFLGKNNKLE